MNNPEISIIVPVYNVQDRLEKCINSLLEQTFTNIEIILVNDGSTDNSLYICKKYFEMDGRIKLISQKNQGLSKARNTGIENATADLLMFVDSDDYVGENFCKDAIYNMNHYDSDMVFFGYTRIENEKISKLLTYGQKDRKLSKDEVFSNLYTDSYAWNKLYKKSLFNTVNYPVGKNYEDLSTTYRLVENTNSISYCAKANYNYVASDSSIVSKMDSKNISDQFGAILGLSDFLKNNYLNIYNDNINELIKFALRYCTYCDSNYNIHYHKRAYDILKRTIVPQNLDLSHKVILLMYKFSAPLTEKLLLLKRWYRNRRGD
ncbi:glycosyltransferase family 2 protein [uncultured Limosilactobacillus sp.]|uniref:glycosyltransferase family 2 protein n=1 Tax=uncultured Limosilactobacillus sp. TaxID=2837629 RepID=UPI0025CCBCB9|nr:glycosyltransferase family 2 protein [uncultured Limosilactobacillus sp.]